MSNESSKLAKNSLDESNEMSHIMFVGWGIIILLIVGAGIGFISGSIKIVDSGEFIVDTSVLLATPVIENKDVNITLTEDTAPPTIELGDTAPEELYQHKSAPYYCTPDAPGETVANLIEEYGTCKRYSNMELDGDGYEQIKYLMLYKCPELKDDTKGRLLRADKLTYIDKVELDEMCDTLTNAAEKATLLEKAATAKRDILK